MNEPTRYDLIAGADGSKAAMVPSPAGRFILFDEFVPFVKENEALHDELLCYSEAHHALLAEGGFKAISITDTDLPRFPLPKAHLT